MHIPPWYWFRSHSIPLPPLPEQYRIVAAIETQFTRLDASVAALRRAQANLKRYRASVLKDACEGRLVPIEAELARSEGHDYEPAGVLLERILAERRARWESQEKRRGKYKEPTSPDTSALPELPEGWVWATVEQVILGDPQNGLYKPKTEYGDGILILRIDDFQDFYLRDREFLLLAAHDYIVGHHPAMDRGQLEHLQRDALHGWEIVDSAARLCVMNLYLHGIGGEETNITVDDSLRSHTGVNYDMVLTNPPFGRKSALTFVNSEGESERESLTVERPDFWATTSNKQLNFLRHVRTLMKNTGRAAIVVPDNVLFEGGAGETVRRRLLAECDVHTLLRLPTGIFYAQGVKTNVPFFDRKPASETPWTKELWIYDLRTNRRFTLKTNPLTRADLDDFVACYNPENRHRRDETARFRRFTYDDLVKRDKANLDIFWLRDESMEDTATLPPPDVIAEEILEDLRAALEQLEEIAGDLAPELTQ